MKKLTVAALAVTTLLSGSAFAHEAGEFFMRAGSATVRPTEGAGGTLGSLGGFSVTNNTQLGLTFTYMATDNIGVELLAATPFRHKIGTRATGDIATVHHLPPTLMAHVAQIFTGWIAWVATWVSSWPMANVSWPQGIEGTIVLASAAIGMLSVSTVVRRCRRRMSH